MCEREKAGRVSLSHTYPGRFGCERRVAFLAPGKVAVLQIAEREKERRKQKYECVEERGGGMYMCVCERGGNKCMCVKERADAPPQAWAREVRRVFRSREGSGPQDREARLSAR